MTTDRFTDQDLSDARNALADARLLSVSLYRLQARYPEDPTVFNAVDQFSPVWATLCDNLTRAEQALGQEPSMDGPTDPPRWAEPEDPNLFLIDPHEPLQEA